MGPLHKLDQFHYHELLDRTHMVAQIIEDHLIQHPLAKVLPGLNENLEEATMHLAEVYQTIGHTSHLVQLVDNKLQEINADYQLDPEHRDYVGFLNTCPNDEWDYDTVHAVETMMVKFPTLFRNMCSNYNLAVEGPVQPIEIIFTRIETNQSQEI